MQYTTMQIMVIAFASFARFPKTVSPLDVRYLVLLVCINAGQHKVSGNSKSQTQGSLKTPVYASSSNIPATLKSHIDTQGSPPYHRQTNRLSDNGRFPQIFQRIQWWFMMVSIGLYYRLHEVAIFIGDPPSLGPMPIAGSSEWNSVSEERSITSFCFHKMSCAREFPSIFI